MGYPFFLHRNTFMKLRFLNERSTPMSEGVVCSLYPTAGIVSSEIYPEGILIQAPSTREVAKFLTQFNIQGPCETVDSGFYKTEDCHIVITPQQRRYKEGFIPFWKETEND